MSTNINLTSKRLGAWIINISKHLINFAPTSIGLSSFENIFFAGKCGSLLVKLSADEPEQLTHTRVKAHAEACGISGIELPIYLKTLKFNNCLDWDGPKSIYEVLPFTRERVLETASDIFKELIDATDEEKALPYLLEFCLLRPRLESETKEFLSHLLPERIIEQLLNLVTQFEILGVNVVLERFEKLYYNEYQFGEEAVKIGLAIASLEEYQQQELNTLLGEVAQKPGIPPDSIGISVETTNFAIGLGLVEESEVTSPAGNAKFLTLPRLPIPSVGKEAANLENDIFHHTKMLLSSLRFGELRSHSSRGRIQDPHILVKALLERDRVGPCTAIGQDYIILETEGVIKTTPAPDREGDQFYMELRRREPAEMVLNLLDSDAGQNLLDAGATSKELELPMYYTGPEVARPIAARKTAKQNPQAIKRFLEVLRT